MVLGDLDSYMQKNETQLSTYTIRKNKFKVDKKLKYKSFSHFEHDGHAVHMLIQWNLPPPLTSTVKSSLFTHVHSNPLSLAARLHRCRANHSRYINNGWNFSGQTSYASF